MGNAKDLTGQRFGKLVAVRPTEERKRGCVVWECKCDCGNDAFVPSSQLISKNTKSCGCLQEKKVQYWKGKRFGRLTVVRRADERGNDIWECLCDCGKTTFVFGSNLMSGNTKSCGCLNKNKTKTPATRTCKECLYFDFCNRDGRGGDIIADDCDMFKDKSFFIELPCKVGTTVWVSPNNGETFHTGRVYGRNENGSYLVFVDDKVVDFVSFPQGQCFYDWFFKIYTREEVKKAIKKGSQDVKNQ